MLDFEEALKFAAARNDMSNTIWGVYITIATTLLAIVRLGQGHEWLNRSLRRLLIAIFVVFAVGSLLRLVQTHYQRNSLLDIAELLANGDASLQAAVKSFRPVPTILLYVFHIALDLCIIGTIGLWGSSGGASIMRWLKRNSEDPKARWVVS